MARGLIHKAVPRAVLDEIKEHLRARSNRGEAAWRSAPHSEDSITGDWGGQLREGWSEPILADGYAWRFRVDYRKFSSSSEEPQTGGDGIFQIEVDRFDIETTPIHSDAEIVENVECTQRFRKGMIFQAKKFDNTKREDLVGQLEKIEKITPGEGSYFEYGPDKFRAASASTVLTARGYTRRISESEFPRLGDYLADEFLECRRGVEGMYFDFEANVLYVPEDNGDIRRVASLLIHGCRILVRGFRLVPFQKPPQVDWVKNGF